MITRRAFLVGAAAAGAVACSSGSGSSAGGTATTVSLAARPAPSLSGPPFMLGVASGDPTPDAVVLWTRLAPDPLRGGGMPTDDVDVVWELADDPSFGDVLASGVATASASRAHTVHADATGLDADRWYHYRFRVGDAISPVGRTRTLPAANASPDRLRLAVASCQEYSNGRYAAHADIAAQGLDLVVFLGDYIYEAPGVDDPNQAVAERKNLGGPPVTLDDYRRRYALYRLDPQLQAAHAACPWILTFDDHEVVNNYAGDDGALGGSGPEFHARRQAAYEAWWENQPLRGDPPTNGEIIVNRNVRWGDLAELITIQTREDASPVPCRDTSTLDRGPGCAEQTDPSRTMLGEAQRAWLFDQLGQADARWTLLGNPVMMAGLDVADPGEPPTYFLDSWDGYPAERQRVVEQLRSQRVPNPVVLTGDYHANFVSEVRGNPYDLSSPVAAVELLGTSISSGVFGVDFTASNPQVKWFDGQHNGYLQCDVTPDAITATFRSVQDVADASSPVTTEATFEVTPGDPPQVRRL